MTKEGTGGDQGTGLPVTGRLHRLNRERVVETSVGLPRKVPSRVGRGWRSDRVRFRGGSFTLW